MASTLAATPHVQRTAALVPPPAASASSSSHRAGAAPRPAPGSRLPAVAHPRRLTAPGHSTPRRSDATLPPPASFFGVGAPEALLVGVVALIVFGPKGLAEAVKSVGKTLRAFQPTIRELASVSSELRSTLEEQIGLDEIRAEISSAVSPLPPPATTPVVQAGADTGGEAAAAAADASASADTPASSLADAVASMQAGLDPAAAVDPDIAAKRAAAAAAAWGGAPPVAAAAAAPATPPAAEEEDSLLGDIPLADLEAELARRRGQA